MHKECKGCKVYFLSKEKYYQYCPKCAKHSNTFCKLCKGHCLKSAQICSSCSNNKIVKAFLSYYSKKEAVVGQRKRGGKPKWFENLYKPTEQCSTVHCAVHYAVHCFSCYQEISYDDCHAGHIFPRHCGGEDAVWNMVPTCTDCEKKTGQNILQLDKKMWKEFGIILLKTNIDLLTHLIINGIVFEKIWLADVQ
jgi:5-methylcytosine-specific restriction endonuclease McrA